MNEDTINQLIEQMAEELKSLIRDGYLHDPVMIGVHTGGVWVARRLHQALGLQEPLGMLNIAFYRDDFTQVGLHPQVKPSELPFEVEGRSIILVDDVLYTGRTVRAAMNEIFDFGRPEQITLAVLVERNGHELPIHADVIGVQMDLEPNEHIKLQGPDPLRLDIQQSVED